MDPFAEKKSPWPKFIVLALVIYVIFKWLGGGLDSNLPKGLKHDTYFEHETFFELKHPTNVIPNAVAPPPATTNAAPSK